MNGTRVSAELELDFMNFSGPELAAVMQTEAQTWMGPAGAAAIQPLSDRADSWGRQTKTEASVCACKNHPLSLKGMFNCICF